MVRDYLFLLRACENAHCLCGLSNCVASILRCNCYSLESDYSNLQMRAMSVYAPSFKRKGNGMDIVVTCVFQTLPGKPVRLRSRLTIIDKVELDMYNKVQKA